MLIITLYYSLIRLGTNLLGALLCMFLAICSHYILESHYDLFYRLFCAESSLRVKTTKHAVINLNSFFVFRLWDQWHTNISNSNLTKDYLHSCQDTTVYVAALQVNVSLLKLRYLDLRKKIKPVSHVNNENLVY